VDPYLSLPSLRGGTPGTIHCQRVREVKGEIGVLGGRVRWCRAECGKGWHEGGSEGGGQDRGDRLGGVLEEGRWRAKGGWVRCMRRIMEPSGTPELKEDSGRQLAHMLTRFCPSLRMGVEMML
jgi:hypothetical protein